MSNTSDIQFHDDIKILKCKYFTILVAFVFFLINLIENIGIIRLNCETVEILNRDSIEYCVYYWVP